MEAGCQCQCVGVLCVVVPECQHPVRRPGAVLDSRGLHRPRGGVRKAPVSCGGRRLATAWTWKVELVGNGASCLLATPPNDVVRCIVQQLKRLGTVVCAMVCRSRLTPLTLRR